jgi:hypothetical protein
MARRWLGRLSLVTVIGSLSTGCGGEEATDTPTPPDVPDPGKCAEGELELPDGTCFEPAVQPNGCHAGELGATDGSCIPAGVQPNGCVAGEYQAPDGSCIAAGIQPDGCMAGEMDSGSGCVAAGIAPDGCGAGMLHDGDVGCTPALPAQPCAAGEMAVPGETTCAPPAACGTGTWGDIPVDATTVYVDGSYVGVSTGTAQQPFVAIQAGIDAAVAGSIVAVAAGSYAESIDLVGQPVALWGRCPSDVTLVGSSNQFSIDIGAGASGSEVHNLAVDGGLVGVVVTDADDVLLEGLWIHDTAERGVNLQNITTAGGVTLRRTLVENTMENGVFVAGVAGVVLDQSVVRDTQPLAGELGRGLYAQPQQGRRSDVTITSSVFRANHFNAISVFGSDLTVQDTAVIDTLPRPGDQFGGRGIFAGRSSVTEEPSQLTLRGAYIARNYDIGVFLRGSQGLIEDSVIADTGFTSENPVGGEGLQVNESAGERSAVTVRRSLIENNASANVDVVGCDAVLEGVVSRGGAPDAAGEWGVGLILWRDEDTGPADVTIRGSVIADNFLSGIYGGGSELNVEGTVVSDTKAMASDGAAFGRGIQMNHDEGASSTTTVAYSVIERNTKTGILSWGSSLTLEGTVVADTQPSPVANEDGDTRGRGVDVESYLGVGQVEIRGCRIEGNIEFGVAMFGGVGTVEGTLIRDTRSTDDEGAHWGWGLFIAPWYDERPTATLRHSVIEASHEAGIYLNRGELLVEGVIVRDMQPSPSNAYAYAISAHSWDVIDPSERSQLTVRGSVVEDAVLAGLLLYDADAVVEGLRIENATSAGDLFGDGVILLGSPTPSSLLMTSSVVGDHARAGISAYGSNVSIGNNWFRCNAFDLTAETLGDNLAEFDDAGDNLCGCGAELSNTCKSVSTMVAPPEPVESPNPDLAGP